MVHFMISLETVMVTSL